MSEAAIRFDFATGAFFGARPVERVGLALLRLGAKLSAPINHVGYSLGARLVRAVLPSKRAVRIEFGDGSLFEFPYGDGYWGQLLDNRSGYAPPVERLLLALRDSRYGFIDCGANFGYMSVLVSGPAYGAKPAIAIEADAENFAQLSHNCAINANRFECRHNAVYSKSGETVDLYGSKHEALSVMPESGDRPRGSVTTLALDDLHDWFAAQDTPLLVLKLDVEGVEIDALEGARRLLNQECLIIYEEHGNDRDHTLSRHLKERHGMHLFAEPDSGGGLIEIGDFAFLDRFKRNRRVGYDLFATNSAAWLPKLRSMKRNMPPADGAQA